MFNVDRFVETLIGITVSLYVLADGVAPAITSIGNTSALAPYATLLGLVILIAVFAIIMGLWSSSRTKSRD